MGYCYYMIENKCITRVSYFFAISPVEEWSSGKLVPLNILSPRPHYLFMRPKKK